MKEEIDPAEATGDVEGATAAAAVAATVGEEEEATVEGAGTEAEEDTVVTETAIAAMIGIEVPCPSRRDRKWTLQWSLSDGAATELLVSTTSSSSYLVQMRETRSRLELPGLETVSQLEKLWERAKLQARRKARARVVHEDC